MFFISKALASQTASKTAAIDSLVSLGLLSGSIPKKHTDQMTLDHWWVGLRVSIKPFWETGRNAIKATYHKGISTIISWKVLAARIMERAERKSHGLNIIRDGKIFIKVQSSQAPDDYWTVKAFPTALTCDCWLFRCLHGRMVRGKDGIKEAPTLLEAIKTYRSPRWFSTSTKRNLRHGKNGNRTKLSNSVSSHPRRNEGMLWC